MWSVDDLFIVCWYFHFHFHHHHQREKERERAREIEHAFAVSYCSLEHAPTISEFPSSLHIDRKREKETRKTRKRDFENVNTFPLKGVHLKTRDVSEEGRRQRRRTKEKKLYRSTSPAATWFTTDSGNRLISFTWTTFTICSFSRIFVLKHFEFPPKHKCLGY